MGRKGDPARPKDMTSLAVADKDKARFLEKHRGFIQDGKIKARYFGTWASFKQLLDEHDEYVKLKGKK